MMTVSNRYLVSSFVSVLNIIVLLLPDDVRVGDDESGSAGSGNTSDKGEC